MLNTISFVPLKNAFSEAYTWLKKSRKQYPSSSDIWDFRREWSVRAEEVIRSFLLGSYRLDVQKKITLFTGETIALWSSRDALVLKVLTVLLQKWLNPVLSKTCYHLKGHGGLKGAEKTIEKFLARAVHLYEQERGESCGSPLLGLYVRRWVSWVNAGLKNINLTARWEIQLKLQMHPQVQHQDAATTLS